MPDPLSGLASDNYAGAFPTGAKALMASVLKRAILDYISRAPDVKHDKLVAWFESPSEDFLSYKNICAVLSVSPTALYRSVRRGTKDSISRIIDLRSGDEQQSCQ
jgi:hypothetical protein